MTRKRDPNRGPRGLHAVLASLSAATAAVAIVVHWGTLPSAIFLKWRMGLNDVLHLQYRDIIGEYLAFLLSSLIFAILFFTVPRFFVRNTSTPVRYAGIVELAIPGITFAVIWSVQPDRFLQFRDIGLLVAEMMLAWLIAALFSLGKWQISGATSLLLLLLHAGLWCRAYYVTFAFSSPHYLSIPVLSTISVLLWGLTRQKSLKRGFAPSEI